jgi:hypothetical protein
MSHVSGKLTLDHFGSASRDGTGSGWGLEVPNAFEGFGAQGHVIILCD